jgi:hypothetical protein
MPRPIRHHVTALDELPVQILAEFDDQPGLHLTFSQVRRQWDLPDVRCREVLEYLVSSNLLHLDACGGYCVPRGKERMPWISS